MCEYLLRKVKSNVNSVQQFSINVALHRYGKLTCHMGSHSVTVTCHPTEVRIPFYPQPKQVLDLATRRDARLSWLTSRESHRPEIEPATCKLQVQRPTAEPPRNVHFNTRRNSWWIMNTWKLVLFSDAVHIITKRLNFFRRIFNGTSRLRRAPVYSLRLRSLLLASTVCVLFWC